MEIMKSKLEQGGSYRCAKPRICSWNYTKELKFSWLRFNLLKRHKKEEEYNPSKTNR
jgi:hypothetical protein